MCVIEDVESRKPLQTILKQPPPLSATTIYKTKCSSHEIVKQSVLKMLHKLLEGVEDSMTDILCKLLFLLIKMGDHTIMVCVHL